MPLFMRWLLDQRRGNSQEDILRMLEQQIQALVDAVSAGNASGIATWTPTSFI
jgi:hypothetical protein